MESRMYDDAHKVQNNQRRLFPDLSTVFASGFDITRFKAIDISTIEQIPEGEMVD